MNWQKFKKIFIKNGGKDGIYAAAQLLQNEPIIKKRLIGKCFKNCSIDCVKNCFGTPNSKKLQKNLLLFTTNQNSEIEIKDQAKALRKTISHFNNLI